MAYWPANLGYSYNQMSDRLAKTAAPGMTILGAPAGTTPRTTGATPAAGGSTPSMGPSPSSGSFTPYTGTMSNTGWGPIPDYGALQGNLLNMAAPVISPGAPAPEIRPAATPSTQGQYSALTGADLGNINWLLNPSDADLAEPKTRGAEIALAMGQAGSPWGYNLTNKLTETERINRANLGSQMLAPYLQRAQATDLATLQGNFGLANTRQAGANQLASGAQAGQNALAERALSGQYGLAGQQLGGLWNRANAENPLSGSAQNFLSSLINRGSGGTFGYGGFGGGAVGPNGVAGRAVPTGGTTTSSTGGGWGIASGPTGNYLSGQVPTDILDYYGGLADDFPEWNNDFSDWYIV